MSERPADARTPPGDDPDEGRAQHVEPDEDSPDAGEAPPDPDRPTDEVRRGNILVEPSPGD